MNNTAEVRIGASFSPSFSRTFENAEKRVGSLERAIKTTNKTLAQVSNVRKVGAAYEQASGKVDKAEKSLSAINKRIEAGEEQTEGLVNAWAKAEGEYEKAIQKQRRLGKALDRGNEELKQAGINTGNLVREQRKLSKSVADLTGRQNNYNKSLAAQKKYQNAAQNMAIGGAATTVAGMGMKRIVGNVIQEGMEFEAAISNVLAVATKAGNKFESLDDAHEGLVSRIKHLGATTSFTGREVAEAAKFLTMAGFDVGQTIDSLESTLSLSRAGNLDLGSTADIMSNIMAPFKSVQKDLQSSRVADVMAAVITTSNTDIQMLGETMKYAAGTAVSARMTLEDTAAMAGIMGNSGIQASMAGTALRGMLNRLSGGSKPVIKALDKIGLSMATLKDESGDLRDPLDIMTDVLTAMDEKGLGTFDRLQALQKIFGVEPASGVAALLREIQTEGKGAGDAMREYRDSIRGVENGLAVSIAKKQMDNLKGDTLLFQSAMSGLKNTLYESVRPALRSVTTEATKFVGKLVDWSKEHPELTRNIAIGAIAVTGLTLSIGGLLLAGAAIAGGLSLWKKGLSYLIPSLHKGSIASAIFSTSSGSIVGGLKAGAVGLATNTRLLFVNTMAWVANTNAQLRNAGSGALAYLKGIPGRIWASTRALAFNTRAAIGNALVWASMSATNALSFLQRVPGIMRAGTLAIWGQTVALGVNTAAWSRNAAVGVLSVGKMMTTVSGWKKIGAVLGKGIKVGSVKAVLAPLRLIGNAIKIIGILARANPIGMFITFLVGGAMLIRKHWEGITTFFSGVMTGIGETFAPAKAEFDKAIKPMQPIIKAVGSAFGAIGKAVGDVIDWFGKLWEPAEYTDTELKAVGETGRSVGNTIGKVLAGAFGIVTKAIELVIKTIETFIGYGEKIAETVGKIKNAVGEIKKEAGEKVEGAVGWVDEKTGGAVSWVGQKTGLWGKPEQPEEMPKPSDSFVGAMPQRRMHGGTVHPGRVYEVNEYAPELLMVSGKQYLMTGAEGKVVPLGKSANEPLFNQGKKADVIPFTGSMNVNNDIQLPANKSGVGSSITALLGSLMQLLQGEQNTESETGFKDAEVVNLANYINNQNAVNHGEKMVAAGGGQKTYQYQIDIHVDGSGSSDPHTLAQEIIARQRFEMARLERERND